MHNKQQKQVQPHQPLVQKQPEFTVAVIFPQHLWAQIHTLQSIKDNKMVLLKLIQTGLPKPQLATLSAKMVALTQRSPTFTITFDTLVTEPSLSDVNSVQIRLIPTAEDAAQLCKLNSELEGALEVPASKRAFVPFLHLTNVPKNQVVATLTKLQQVFKPFTISVQDLYFVSRDGKKDFSIQKSFPLAPPNSTIGLESLNINENNNNNDTTVRNGSKESWGVKKPAPVASKPSPSPSSASSSSSSKVADNTNEIGPCFQFASDSWTPVKDVKNVVAQQFKIATLNVLFDYHDSDKIHTHLRTPATFNVLREIEADVIALEEVTSPFLVKLLAEEWVQKNYFVSSLEIGYYGQFILSRFPFRSCQVTLGRPVNKKLQHTAKKAVIAEFILNGRSTHVSAVHLTSDKSENSAEKRKLQLSQIDAFMTSRGTENFIVGDFNFGDDGDNVLPSAYEDIWPLLHPNEAGFTYDVVNNSMAKVTTSKHKDARFDRILSGSNLWSPKSIALFGNKTVGEVEGTPIFISDHYGVYSEFEIASRIEIPSIDFSNKVESDPLYVYLKAKNLLADKSYSESRKEILAFLTEAMGDVFGEEDWKMHLIGSSRLGIDGQGSDIDLVVVGSLSRPQFFDFSVKVLSAQESVANVRAISDTTVPVVKFTIAGVHIDLQYCCVPYGTKLPRSTLDIDDLVLFKLDRASYVAINGVRDSELIVRAVPDFEPFRLLVVFIKMWAKERRIYSGSIGYLGGYPLAILAARLFHLNPTLSSSQFVSQFFIEYGAWDLRTTPMSLPGVTFPTLDPKKHAVPIFTPTKPVRVASRNGTQSTRAIITSEFERGLNIIKNGASGEVLWDELVVPENVAKYGANLLLNVSTKSESDFMQWAGYVESRLVDLILQIERLTKTRDPVTAVRPCDRKYPCPSSPSQKAFFFISIDVPPQKCAELAQLMASSLDFTAFSKGANEGMNVSIDITSDVSSFVSSGEEVERVRKMKKAGEKKVLLGPCHSLRATGELGVEEEEWKEEEETTVISPADLASIGINNYAEAARSKMNNQIKYGGEFSEKKIRMRTSVEVFNRINWDASLPNNEFIIGYDDRFLGIMEVPFDEFDLESIPLHRIRIFKRNGIIVWSRNDRVDALFKY